MQLCRIFLVTSVVLGLGLLALTPARCPAQRPPASLIRNTEPLSAKEQLKRFHVPDGFEIQLVAAEPDIQKPLNLAFDADGRLWASGSVEYPYAAEEGQGRDSIRVLEDLDQDGRAKRISTFVDGLNIPMGLYPYGDGVVAYTISDIVYFRDTDQDGRADRHDVLYADLGTPVDTHGMQNAFRRGYDGWLYICHGFRNDSTIEGRDGSRITLNSGNSYRVRLDGSRVEQFTWGQVNPFGSAFTPWGDLVTADCHSKPLTLLLRGGYYSSFGKPHDGLGYVPDVMRHGHGSTGLAGVAIVGADGRFPAEYQNSLFVGNVVTSRVHRDAIQMQGSTLEAIEQADFVTCDDPWFRPVDLRIGPDGALYIADFYNRIIGHYEVPLDHPQRDRERGRIWRVVYKGSRDSKPMRLQTASTEQVLTALSDSTLNQRMLAADQLADRIGVAALPALQQVLADDDNELLQVHGHWVLHRWGRLDVETLAQLCADERPAVRVHAMRMLAERTDWDAKLRQSALQGLSDTSGLVRRAAADALGQHAAAEQVQALLAAAVDSQPDDPHLQHSIRIALKHHFQQPEVFANLEPQQLPQEQLLEAARVSLAIPHASAAEVLEVALRRKLLPTELLPLAMEHASKHLPADRLPEFVGFLRSSTQGKVDLQLQLLGHLKNVVRDQPQAGPLREWAIEVVTPLLASTDASLNGWISRTEAPLWDFEKRLGSDGQEHLFLSSLPGGEQQTGRLQSRHFPLPARIEFDLCGHRGFPEDDALKGNRVELRAADGTLLRTAYPPRNDQAQRVVWELQSEQGQEGYLILIDELALRAFAWLGVARVSGDLPPLPEVPPRLASRRTLDAISLTRELRLFESADLLRTILVGASDATHQRAAALGLATLSELPRLAAIVPLLGSGEMPADLQGELTAALAHTEGPADAEQHELIRRVVRSVPFRLQEQVAAELALSQVGAETLLLLVEEGSLSPRLLQKRALQERLVLSRVAEAEARVLRVIRELPPLNTTIQSSLDRRRDGYRNAVPDAGNGQTIFKKHCANCHRVGTEGALVGPQLDGVGNRGLERVLEDVLDPNRNIDAAFHTTVLATVDGRVLTGLFRREEGQHAIFADAKGQEFRLHGNEIDERKLSPVSLMPDNFHTQVSESEFYDLIAYLLTLRAASTPPQPPPGE